MRCNWLVVDLLLVVMTAVVTLTTAATMVDKVTTVVGMAVAPVVVIVLVRVHSVLVVRRPMVFAPPVHASNAHQGQSDYEMTYVTLTFSKLRSTMHNRGGVMANRPSTTGKGTHALRLLRAAAQEGKQVFSTAEAREMAVRAGVPDGYVYELLHHMTQKGLLTRLRRGLYSVSEIAPGLAGVHPFVIATRVVTPSAVSHWSALNYHGLTDQVPRVVTAFTPKKVVTPSMRGSDRKSRRRHAWEIAGVRYEYVVVKRQHFYGIDHVWVDENSRVPITDPERTVLETFVSPRIFGGIGEALSTLHDHVDSLDAAKLVTYARQYGKISVAKRLGWALEQAGAPESVLHPLLTVPASGYYHPLDPSRPPRGPCDERWMIQNNLPKRTGP